MHWFPPFVELLVLAVVLDMKLGEHLTPDPVQDFSAEDNRCFFVYLNEGTPQSFYHANRYHAVPHVSPGIQEKTFLKWMLLYYLCRFFFNLS